MLILIIHKPSRVGPNRWGCFDVYWTQTDRQAKHVYQGIGRKGSWSGLAWERQSHCFANEFGITHAHSFGTDTQHDCSQGNCRTMSSSLFYYIICYIPNNIQSLFIPFKYSLRIFFILLNEFLILNTNMIFYSFILSNRSCGGGGGQFDTPPLSVFFYLT